VLAQQIIDELLARVSTDDCGFAPFSDGVHSVAGSIGYWFYYPWIAALERLYRTVGGSWQNNWPLYEAVLCLLQTIPLSIVVFLLMAFKHR
jgi:hypothetical protein